MVFNKIDAFCYEREEDDLTKNRKTTLWKIGKEHGWEDKDIFYLLCKKNWLV